MPAVVWRRPSKHIVRAIAERRFVGVFAAADVENTARVGLEANRLYAGVFVLAIAKRLTFRKPAGAPGVHPAFFEFDLVGTFLGGDWICHSILSGEADCNHSLNAGALQEKGADGVTHAAVNPARYANGSARDAAQDIERQ